MTLPWPSQNIDPCFLRALTGVMIEERKVIHRGLRDAGYLQEEGRPSDQSDWEDRGIVWVSMWWPAKVDLALRVAHWKT